MDTQDNSSLNESAVTTESAPVNSLTDESAVNTESAPVEEVETQTETTDDTGSEPQSKAVKELIAQRKRRQAAEQEAAYWRGRAEAAAQPEKTQPAVQKPVADLIPPSIDQFETWEEFDAAKLEYSIAVAEQRLTQKIQQQQQQKQQEKVQSTFWEKVATLEDAGDAHIRDSIATVGKAVSPVVADLVVQSDDGVALVKYLEKNLKEAYRISQLHPILAAKEIGKIEARLASTPKSAPPKKVSQAPEPISTVKPSGAGVVDVESLSINDWITRRNKEAGYR